MMIVFDNEQLLPSEWRGGEAGRALRIFNPGLLRDGDGWLLAYRVVAEPDRKRRIAICRLDREFGVVAESQIPLSDLVRFRVPHNLPLQATEWFADPRLYRFGDRLFVYWNSGWHEPRNYQYLQELDARTLQPVGAPRELTLATERQKLEKNWGLFEAESGLHAVYGANPHRVLSFSLAGEQAIVFTDAFAAVPNAGGFAQVNGGLRGGAPPQRGENRFYSFCHSIENLPNGYGYVPSVYTFSAEPPFAPLEMPTRPLPIEVPVTARRRLPKLNPAIGDIIYPAGAAYDGGRWLISVGIDDERCAIAVLNHADVAATLGNAP
jgi:hypothetical protein